MLRAISLLTACATLAPALASQQRLPNLVVIFIDDMAYADIGPFGGEVPTPRSPATGCSLAPASS